MRKRPAPSLALLCAAAYTLLIVYASLHPFSGWTSSGADLFGFLFAAWPRYFTFFDLITNVLAYILFGYCWSAAFQLRISRFWAVIATLACGTLLSLSMETIQNFIPSRVASNVDLGCNSLGALLGAVAGARWGELLHDHGGLARWRLRHVIAPPSGDYGAILVGVWLLVQLSPENLLFGCGGLRNLLDLPAPLPFSVAGFAHIETAIAASGVLAAGLFVSHVLRRPRGWHMLVMFCCALVVRAFSAALLVAPNQFAHWVTTGNMEGLGLGLLLLLPLLRLAPVPRRAATALALLAVTALVNIAPENPYLAQAANAWQQGHFLNFNGLTRIASVLWPFLALSFLMRSHGRHEKDS